MSIVVGTFNRIAQLRQCLDSIRAQTQTPYQLYVTDAGSTDGTVEYLQALAETDPRVTPILVGRRLGQAKALNDVFRMVRTEYVCWLSDDNVVVDHGLDVGVNILRSQPQLGMVGLKVRDAAGPHTNHFYIGGVSSAGVLNVNQGMLPTCVLQEMRGFAEEYPNYGIDPDLTTRVLLAGWGVAYTRAVAVHHYREWQTQPDSAEARLREQQLVESQAIYRRKFGARSGWLGSAWLTCKRWIFQLVERTLLRWGRNPQVGTFLGYNWRDWFNVCHSRYISVWDFLRYGRQSFHLVQQVGTRRRRCPAGAHGEADRIDISRSAHTRKVA